MNAKITTELPLKERQKFNRKVKKNGEPSAAKVIRDFIKSYTKR